MDSNLDIQISSYAIINSNQLSGDMGSYMLMQKISQKGVSKSIIQEVLQEFDMTEVAERTAEKLLKKYQGKLPARALQDKIIQSLTNKGFSYSEAKTAFDQLDSQVEEKTVQELIFKELDKQYRKYNIKTVVGPDDYASMQEVVRRRYKRMIESETPLPDLIITDGGKGQMEVVRAVVEDELQLTIPIAGLAKDNRHRTNELLYGFPPQTIGIPTNSELFKVLTQIQDEVHRFAISFHRDKRSKHQLHSELDDIKGIGSKSKEQLLQRFKTVKKIKEADIQELTEVIGSTRAMLLYNYFHSKP